MNKESGTSKGAADKLSRVSSGRPASKYSAEEEDQDRPGVCGARRAFLPCAAAKGSPRACAILGRRSSWKPERPVCQATRLVRRRRQKS